MGLMWYFKYLQVVIDHCRLDPNPEYWEGKRGACAGALQAIVANRDRGKPPNGVSDIIALLRDNGNNGQAEVMLKAIRKFANVMK